MYNVLTITEKKYTTLDLIEDLRAELQQFSKVLALLFPKRIKKFEHRALSIFLGKSQNYVSKIVWNIKNNNNFRILDDEDGLKKLETIIFDKYSLTGKKYFSLIDDYRKNHLSTLEFINLV